jgi:cytosine/adenosine deaminase-related metal-dependent hydrolase
MGLDGYGLAEGDRADLVLVDAESVTHAVVSHPPRKLVMKAGRVVARDGQTVTQAP